MLFAFGVALSLTVSSSAPLVTVAEASGFQKTGNYDEVVRLCAEAENTWPGRARCFTFGTTPEGRDMKALAVSDDGALTPESVRERHRPVVFAQGGIHAGEIDGKDAGFWFVRDVLQGKAAPGSLRAVTFVFVPVFNVDGHERKGPNNRPNQRGPQEMGWRTTAQNLNLNRDYMKADAPEMRAMLRLWNAWDPAVAVDLHVTDGAKFQHDISVIVSPALAHDGPVAEAAQLLSSALQARLTSKEGGAHLPVPFYPSFEKDDEPSSGIADGIAPPRFSHGYAVLRNRLGILVETHSWKTYAQRVKATRDALAAILAEATMRAAQWRSVEDAADVATAQGTLPVTLSWENTERKVDIDFLGYAYTRVPSLASGAVWTRYDERKPEVWKIPLWPEVKPKLQVTPPRAYVVPPVDAPLVRERLDAHGVRYEVVAADSDVHAWVFRATKTTFGTASYEGHQTLKVEGAWRLEKQHVSAGALRVPTAQAKGKVVVALFEPTAADSFLAWGLFNARFEQKEYMEAYVAEEVAVKMLQDPATKQVFEERLRTDPEFAKSPEARLDFFYRRHKSYDARKDVYPVIALP